MSWLVANFYPPVFISLAFIGGVIALALERDGLRFQRVIALLSTTACAGGEAVFYLKD